MNKMIHRLLQSNEEKIVIRRGSLWSFISSVCNAAVSAVIIFFISLQGQTEVTGYFSIASAIAYQCQYVGLFGSRYLQISDIDKEYSFSDYFYLRVFSTILMFIMLIYMAFGSGYNLEKALVVLSYGIYRALDVAESIFYDDYQRDGRLDVGVIMQTIRYITSLVLLILVYMISGSLAFGCFVSIGFSIVLIAIQNAPLMKYFHITFDKIDFKKLKKLFMACLPVCISSILSIYILNAAKYAIDGNLNDTIQGYFAILSLPMFTINMLATVIYRPYISFIASAWLHKDYQEYKRLLFTQILVIVGLTVGISLFGYIIGLRLLEIIYQTNLMDYMSCFIILLIGAGLNTLAVFISNVLVIIREYRNNLLIYGVSFIATFLLADKLVIDFELLGGSVLYFISSLIIVIISFVIVIKKYLQVKID